MKTWEVTWWGKVVGHVRAPTSADARKLAFGWLGRTKLGIFAIGVKEERPTGGSLPQVWPVVCGPQRRWLLRSRRA